MKYANFKDAGRCNINIGDYLQFIVTEYLLNAMNVPDRDIVRLGFHELADYDGEEVIFPFCYSIIDFVHNGKIEISDKIKPVFLAVTLSTIDKFMNLDRFLEDGYNKRYLTQFGPIGCRDEITYNAMQKHGIPSYINGCMTAIFPTKPEIKGNKVLLVDAPKTLLPYIPAKFFRNCECYTQQFYFDKDAVADFKDMFRFVKEKYQYYAENAQIVITSRLHVALPLTAMGIPVILAKDNVDGRFSFIERYIPIYDKKEYQNINWNPEVPQFEKMKKILMDHALGRIQGDVAEEILREQESQITDCFISRKKIPEYKPSHTITHTNGERFDEYAERYWKQHEKIKYAFWGVSDNNFEFWKEHIESQYPNAELVAIYDSYREGKILNLMYQKPEAIKKNSDVCIIVCAVGAAQAARKLFKNMGLVQSQYCITSDCFIADEDVEEMR